MGVCHELLVSCQCKAAAFALDVGMAADSTMTLSSVLGCPDLTPGCCCRGVQGIQLLGRPPEASGL